MRVALGVVAGALLGLSAGWGYTQALGEPAAAACAYRDGGALPDPRCTPGALNPSVTQGDVGSTICSTGWAAVIRPPESVTAPQKRASMARYGVVGAADYEYDHLVPLELGGAVDDPRNLWPEPRGGALGASVKDGVENHLRSLVCARAMTLARARRIMRRDWTVGR